MYLKRFGYVSDKVFLKLPSLAACLGIAALMILTNQQSAIVLQLSVTLPDILKKYQQ